MNHKTLAAAVLLVVFNTADAQESRLSVLTGTVTTTDGQPLPSGCTVTLREARGRRRGTDSAPAGERPQQAGSGGTFRFETPAGGYALVVTASGYARARRFVALDGETFVTIALSPSFTVTGRLVDARSGTPIAQGRLRASVAGGMGDAVDAVSDAAGAFTLAGLPSGAEDLRIVATASGHAPRDVALDLPAPADGVTIALEPGWHAEVRVVDDRGQPVSGVTVRGRIPFAVPYSNLERHDFEARSDASGIATFDELVPEDPVVFEVAHDRYVPTRSPVVLPRFARNGGATGPTDIVLTDGRAAHVSVRDAFEVPIEDAEVRILPLVEPRLDVGGHTDADADRGSIRLGHVDAAGNVAFEKLPAEILTVEVRSPLYETRMIVIDVREFPIADATVRLERDPSPPAASMPWLSSVREAFGTAETTGLPVMISMAMDGERANDWIAAHHFKDPEVIRVAEILPCVLSSVFGEGGIHAEGVDHSENDGICMRYGSIPCAAHQEVEAYARQELLPDTPSFQVPRHIFVTPDGRELEHRAYYLSERELRWMILRALRSSESSAAVWLAARRLQPLWRALCSENDSDERKSAITMVAQLASSGDEYALALLQDFALDAMPAVVRLRILEMLLLPAIPDPVRALRSYLHDPERLVRQRAWQLLKGVSSRLDLGAAVPYLSRDERDDSVVAAALRALRVEDQTNSILVADADQGDRWTLVEMLLETLDAASIKGVDLVLDSAGTEGRNRILRALAAIPEDESSIRRVFGHAAAPEAAAVSAIRALATAHAGLDDRGRELLLQQARSLNPLVRQEATTQLGRHQVPGSMPMLRAALEDAVKPVRIAAAIGLWKQGDRSGARVMVEGLDDPEFGDGIRSMLEAAYTDSLPQDAEDWDRWINDRGWVPKKG